MADFQDFSGSPHLNIFGHIPAGNAFGESEVYVLERSWAGTYLNVEDTVLKGPLAGSTNASITRHSATRPRLHSLTMRRSSSRS